MLNKRVAGVMATCVVTFMLGVSFFQSDIQFKPSSQIQEVTWKQDGDNKPLQKQQYRDQELSGEEFVAPPGNPRSIGEGLAKYPRPDDRRQDSTGEDPTLVLGLNVRNLSEGFYRLAPNVFDGVPLHFLPDFKNPCWRSAPSTAGEGKASTPSLRCLPYFFLAGTPKSGTTDIYSKLVMHPQVARTRMKEPHWWTRSRINQGSWTTESLMDFGKLNEYIDLQSAHIAPMLTAGKDPSTVIGDASASTFWDNTKWRQFFPDAEAGPPHVIAEIIGTVLPDVKVILTLRNPVTRLYSDFNYFHHRDYSQGPSIFHDQTMQFLKNFRVCRERWNDTRTCAYDMQMQELRISIGMYSVYLRDWLKVLPRDQFKIIRLEDWSADCVGVLSGLYEFLQLTPLDPANLATICQRRIANVRKRAVKPILPQTKQILQDFYQPFNIELAEILGDDKYLWMEDQRDLSTSEIHETDLQIAHKSLKPIPEEYQSMSPSA